MIAAVNDGVCWFDRAENGAVVEVRAAFEVNGARRAVAVDEVRDPVCDVGNPGPALIDEVRSVLVLHEWCPFGSWGLEC